MDRPPSFVNDDRAEVDELMLEITDYKNDYADMAIEKLFRKCSTSWEDSLGQPNTVVLWLAADPSCGNWCRTSTARAKKQLRDRQMLFFVNASRV